MTTAIIILNYNSSEETIECIKSLKKVDTQNSDLKIIVVDNHSREEEVEKLKKFLKSEKHPIHTICNDKNLGYSGGNNTGISFALKNGADYILVLNNDTIVDKNFLTPLIETLESDDSIGAAVPKIFFAKGHEFHKDRYKKEDLGRVIWYAGGEIDWMNVIGKHTGVDEVDDGEMYAQTRETEYATGACVLFRASTLKRVGLFDNAYFLYYEDSDLSMRIKRLKERVVFVPDSIIWHKNAASTGGSGSDLQDYFITRNRLVFGFKYAPIRARVALIREAIRLLLKGRMWQKRGVIDFYLGNLGKGSYPVSD